MGAATATVDRRRILIVDDIELNRVLTEAVLRSAPYDVDCVEGGMAALAALEANSYDLVLMDLDMPGLSGHDAAIAIRQCRRGTTKLAALSARGGTPARLRSRAVGMSAHIARPIGPHDLLRQIEQMFCQDAVAERPDPWEQALYGEWVERLGAKRMEGFLVKLLDQFRSLLLLLLESDEQSTETLHRRAHDAASTAGMLGFTEVTRCCRALLETADAVAESRARPGLTDALERAVLRLDRHLSDETLACDQTGASGPLGN